MAFLLPQLLESSVKLWPDRMAISDGVAHYTYRALDARSNQLAHVLQQAGVERGDRVGIYLEKSCEAVAAMVAVMKAGAAYVPLDPAVPVKRVAYMVDNCRMKALITTEAQLVALQPVQFETSRLHCVLVPSEGRPAAGQPVARGALAPLPGWTLSDWSAVLRAPTIPPANPSLIESDLAYLLYTSGSTGVPKGVMISHRASLTFIDWACDTFALQPTDRVSNHAPFHFDLSIFDIFATIKAGGTIVLIPPALSIFPHSLADFIAQQEISIWYSAPSALTRLLLYGRLERYVFPKLRTVLFAGEVFPVKFLRQLMTTIPHATFHNLYGPTETNVCTWYSVPPLEPERVTPISIGKACANSEVLVLNEQNAIVAPGEVGELCVRGPGLMTGYWGLPEKTRQLLTPLVVHTHMGAEHVYHTGDLVRQDTDGNYTYLGRRDNQIKSRGYRIELGEIESVLYSHPAVEEAAVIPLPDDELGNTINAFVVTRNGRQGLRAELEVFCAERLPKYMLPYRIEFLPVLPKTSTGKVDKTQLATSLLT